MDEPVRGRWATQYVLTLAGIAVVAAAVLLPLRAVQSSRRIEPTPSPPASAEVELFRVPGSVVMACQRAEADTSFPLLCPAVLPRRQEPCDLGGRTVPAGRDKCPGVARPRLLRSGSRVNGLEIGYSAPREDRPDLNGPGRFLHLVLLGGRAAGDPENFGRLVGSRELGGHGGELYRGRPGGLHHSHIVFVWRDGGTRYAASLHGWDSPEATIELLDRLVASLVPSARLG